MTVVKTSLDTEILLISQLLVTDSMAFRRWFTQRLCPAESFFSSGSNRYASSVTEKVPQSAGTSTKSCSKLWADGCAYLPSCRCSSFMHIIHRITRCSTLLNNIWLVSMVLLCYYDICMKCGQYWVTITCPVNCDANCFISLCVFIIMYQLCLTTFG